MRASEAADVLRRVDEVAAKVIEPEADAVDAEGRWPARGLRALFDAGLAGVAVPATKGGLGHGLGVLLRACERLGSACASTAMCYGMHAVASAVLAAKATPEQQRRFVEPVARGARVASLALSEPGSGSHFYLPATRARRDGDAYVLDGAKAFVTSGGRADVYVMSAVSSDATAPPGQFSCFAVEEGAPGLAWGPAWQGVGMRGNESRGADLRGVRVPLGNLLGEEGDETWYVFHVVAPYFVSAMAGTYLGVAQGALDHARAHLRARRHGHSGEPLSRSAVLQHRLGTLWADVERARRLAYWAADESDAGGPDAMPGLLSAKAEVGEMAVRVANECLTLLGGLGYAQGGRLDRHLRDARAAPVMAPTTDHLRLWTGRWLLGEPLLSG